MLVLTLSDLAGLILFGWVAGVLTAAGMLIWIMRNHKEGE